ncbi:hypothetical protein MKX03_021210 [Papaver bracteatum]|nr:hypothetical protein MKX03_021210 [Papaver bracteatum]
MAEEHHHTISGLVGKLITESEVNCEAHKYYEIFKHHEDVPNAVPHQYTAVKVIEGHGITSGCIKEWDYIHEGKTLVVKETTTYDDEAMTIHHSAVGGDVWNDYKKFDATLSVKPKANGKGCIARWTIDYVKLNEDSPRLTVNLKNITKIWKHHEEVPNVTQHISEVKVIEGHGITSGCVKQWNYTVGGKEMHVHEKTTYNDETRTIHHSAVGGDVMKNNKKFDATLVVNPKANGHGSIVSWTIEYEKLNEDSPVPIDYLQFFQFQIEDLNSHLLCASA